MHKLSIHDLLTRFFQSFDDENWAMMRDCLCDDVFTDYSSFRKVPPGTISGDCYVAERRATLHGLEMQHNFFNLRVEVDGGALTAIGRCNYSIHRFRSSFGGMTSQYFNSYGHYVFGFANTGGTWRISRITQNLLRNHGNGEIHGGMRSHEKTH